MRRSLQYEREQRDTKNVHARDSFLKMTGQNLALIEV